jgi:predicted amidophosphoribosyltransferase
LPYEERANNIRGAFASQVDLHGKTVAVVDDVMTTGATVNELARVLKRAGAARVHILVVARAVLR